MHSIETYNENKKFIVRNLIKDRILIILYNSQSYKTAAQIVRDEAWKLVQYRDIKQIRDQIKSCIKELTKSQYLETYIALRKKEAFGLSTTALKQVKSVRIFHEEKFQIAPNIKAVLQKNEVYEVATDYEDGDSISDYVLLKVPPLEIRIPRKFTTLEKIGLLDWETLFT